MTVVTSNTTAKKVEIRKNGGFDNSFIAQLVQTYDGKKSVLQTKFYALAWSRQQKSKSGK